MNTKMSFLTEPVKEVKIIVDDAIIDFKGPKRVWIEDMSIEHGGWLGEFSLGFKIETFNQPQKRGFISEPVKEVKIIFDDVTIIFESPKSVWLADDVSIEHGMLGEYPFEFKTARFRIETLIQPKAYRTIRENGITKYESIL